MLNLTHLFRYLGFYILGIGAVFSGHIFTPWAGFIVGVLSAVLAVVFSYTTDEEK